MTKSEGMLRGFVGETRMTTAFERGEPMEIAKALARHSPTGRVRFADSDSFLEVATSGLRESVMTSTSSAT